MASPPAMLIAVGDILPGDHYFSLGHGIGSRCEQGGMERIFAPVRSILRQGEVVFGNLEGVLSHSSSRESVIEQQVFRGRPERARELKALGFNLLHIANNHIRQHGPAAAWETVSALESAGIEPLGLARPGRPSSVPVIREIGGRSFGFLGYSLVPEKYGGGDGLYARGPGEVILSDVQALAREVEVLVVSIHYGSEGMDFPPPWAVVFLRRLVEQGARLVLGHHSHVFQPAEIYRGGAIFYSLGDIVFDLFWDERFVRSAIACISFPPGGGAPDIILFPVRFTPDYLLLPSGEGGRLGEEGPSLGLDPGRSGGGGRGYEAELRRLERSLQKKKALFFLRNLWRGRTFWKIKFLLAKLVRSFPG